MRGYGVLRRYIDVCYCDMFSVVNVVNFVFVGFWDRDYVSQLPCVRYYVFVKSRFKHTREECES